jgi:hypothetical protein
MPIIGVPSDPHGLPDRPCSYRWLPRLAPGSPGAPLMSDNCRRVGHPSHPGVSLVGSLGELRFSRVLGVRGLCRPLRESRASHGASWLRQSLLACGGRVHRGSPRNTCRSCGPAPGDGTRGTPGSLGPPSSGGARRSGARSQLPVRRGRLDLAASDTPRRGFLRSIGQPSSDGVTWAMHNPGERTASGGRGHQLGCATGVAPERLRRGPVSRIGGAGRGGPSPGFGDGPPVAPERARSKSYHRTCSSVRLPTRRPTCTP